MPHMFFQRLENRQSTQALLPFTPHKNNLENSSSIRPSSNRTLPFYRLYGIDIPDSPFLSSFLSFFSQFFPWIN